MLVCAEFNSAQCWPILDLQTVFENILKIRPMDPRFPGNGGLQKSKKISSTPRSVSLPRGQLRAVLDNFGFADISISDSAQC